MPLKILRVDLPGLTRAAQNLSLLFMILRRSLIYEDGKTGITIMERDQGNGVNRRYSLPGCDPWAGVPEEILFADKSCALQCVGNRDAAMLWAALHSVFDSHG